MQNIHALALLTLGMLHPALSFSSMPAPACISDRADVEEGGLTPQRIENLPSRGEAPPRVVFEELYLAKAGYEEEAHEIAFVETSRSLFMSMLTENILHKIPLDDHLEMKDYRYHRSTKIGPERGGLHNVAKSQTRGDNMLWLSTQCENRVLLVDSNDLSKAPSYTLAVPTHFDLGQLDRDPMGYSDTCGMARDHCEGGAQCGLAIGGPHSVREAADGSIWVTLKGMYTSEVYRRVGKDNHICTGGSWQLHSEDDRVGYAVWHINPDEFDMTKSAFGGTLYPAKKSPVMIDIDRQGNVFTGQDSAPWVHRVDTKGNAQQIAMPKGPDGVQIPTSGPAVVAAPDGSAIFIASLMNEEGLIVQFRSGETTPRVITALKDTLDTRYWASPEQGLQQRIIHFAFSNHGGWDYGQNTLYALTSSLLEPQAPEQIIALQFTEDWSKPNLDGDYGLRRLTLPGYNKGAHRICIAEGNSSSSPGAHMLRRAFVSNTLSNTITMAKSKNTEWNW